MVGGKAVWNAWHGCQVRTTSRSWDKGVLTDLCLKGVLTDLCLTLYYSAIIIICWLIFEDMPSSLVSIVTRLPLYRWRIFVYLTVGTEIFQFVTLSGPTLGLIQLWWVHRLSWWSGLPDNSPQSIAKGYVTKTVAVPVQWQLRLTLDCRVNRLPFLIH